VTSEVLVRGDQLPVLVPLAVVQASGEQSPTAVVWGVDLSNEPSRRAAQKRFRRVCSEVGAYAAAHARVTHLFVVYSHGGALPEGACLSTAGLAATRLHSDMERSRGRSFEVVALDVTGWENGELFRDRILEAVTRNADAAGDVALGWHDITDASIHSAAMRQFC
jgi:hypothetical protein